MPAAQRNVHVPHRRVGLRAVTRTPPAHAAVAVLLGLSAVACAQVPEPADDGVIDRRDGVLEDPVSPFDTDAPALVNLDRDLLSAVQQAARDARAQGIEIAVTSGWRSRAYQQELLDEAITAYGSEAEARRRVAAPETSRHVTGDAVDIGPTDAASWFSQHGAEYSLCQTYANEIWHYELTASPDGACPEMLEDASAG